jgi:hypothetical protein
MLMGILPSFLQDKIAAISRQSIIMFGLAKVRGRGALTVYQVPAVPDVADTSFATDPCL